MNSGSEGKNRITARVLQHWQLIRVLLVAYDVIAVSFAYFFALFLRFDARWSMIPHGYLHPWMRFAPVYAVFCIAVFFLLKLYHSIWRFASFSELKRVLAASGITCAFHVIAITLIFGRMPISYYVVGAGVQFLLVLGIRFSYRFILLLRAGRKTKDDTRIMLIGGGAAGRLLISEMQRSDKIDEKIVCIIDENPNKWNRYIQGIPVVGGNEDIPEMAEKYNIEKIYIAIPSLSMAERRALLDICQETGRELMILPAVRDLIDKKVTVSALKKVEVEDLLGREPVQLNSPEIRAYLTGKTVLITGGGGSIGSELARQCAAVEGLKRLIIFDIYENNAHAIGLELRDKYPTMDLKVLIGSVRNSRKVKQVISDYRPDVIFHAAAHKHVPLMEWSPCEAIKNNAIGTYYTAFAAMAYGVEKFVLISTDKAVNPVNIMGASKRICEMIVQVFARKIKQGRASELPDLHAHTGTNRTLKDNLVIPDRPKTEFVAVRFGNVLGSNGSVIPRFREQIAKGGPVTVTHPDIIRYFMTIPEAVSLVLTAATFGGDGNIYVLDMGEEVKIDDLARNMIRLSGLRPDEDIQIVYTGLRPGEKLYEERLMDEEGLTATEYKQISIGKPLDFDEDEFLRQLWELMEAAYEDREDIRELVMKVVPTYRPAEEKAS